jgi:hypothetical protein
MKGKAMIGTGHSPNRLRPLHRVALILIGLCAATPAMALDFETGKLFDLHGPIVSEPSVGNSALVGDSARQTADSDPASLNSSGPDASKLADTAQSIYCKDKGGVIWYAADVLSGIAQKPNDTYQVEPIRCP